jgi:response regulator of citrate/malate metabolism
MRIKVAIIHDEPRIRELLADMLHAWQAYDLQVETAYGNRQAATMRRWIAETDLFILGLERHYKEGRCTEGVETGHSFLELGKKVLIVGAETHADTLNLPFYWDFMDPRSFLEAAKEVILKPVITQAEYQKLSDYFKERSARPVGH